MEVIVTLSSTFQKIRWDYGSGHGLQFNVNGNHLHVVSMGIDPRQHWCCLHVSIRQGCMLDLILQLTTRLCGN